MSSIGITDLSILLIEPSSTQLKVIIKHLREEGIANIEGVATGVEALEKLNQYKPDLIISSLYLPEMTATDLILQIRKTQELQDIPFMLISSESNFTTLEPIRQAGVVAILAKPFFHDDLHRALKATLEIIDPGEITLENYDVEALRVLVVDDSRLAQKHIIRILTNLGIKHITTADNGKEAVEVFSSSPDQFDLIVTDYNMPEMDGRELITYIREKLLNPYIPILMVTSERDKARLSSIQQAGVSAIFDKPFDPMTVKEILYRILED